MYYCGSYTTPGNGHDLSLLSGFVIADLISGGGSYPFKGKEKACEDFERLKKIMYFWLKFSRIIIHNFFI